MIITGESSNLSSAIDSKPELHQFLVDGILFELSEELIQKRAPNSILGREERRLQFYDNHKNAYIFDQPADVFEVLVYFISTGLLSQPININNVQLYSLLTYFEMDEFVINTLKNMEHLVFEINWEKTQHSNHSWFYELFSLPFSTKSKILNIFFFAITIISYGILCFEYTFALPLFHLQSSLIDNTTRNLIPVGLDFKPTIISFSYLTEMIYLLILIIEFLCRFVYVSNKLKHLINYFTIIDILSIISCIFYLTSIIHKNDLIIQLISCFRFLRVLKLSRYSTYIRQYIQTIISNYEISILIFLIFISLCMFFGNIIYGMSLIDRHRIYSTPFESFYYSYETILTIGFGIHIPSTPYLTWITIGSVLFGMMCLSLPVPFLAIYNFNLENYEQEKINMLL